MIYIVEYVLYVCCYDCKYFDFAYFINVILDIVYETVAM